MSYYSISYVITVYSISRAWLHSRSSSDRHAELTARLTGEVQSASVYSWIGAARNLEPDNLIDNRQICSDNRIDDRQICSDPTIESTLESTNLFRRQAIWRRDRLLLVVGACAVLTRIVASCKTPKTAQCTTRVRNAQRRNVVVTTRVVTTLPGLWQRNPQRRNHPRHCSATAFGNAEPHRHEARALSSNTKRATSVNMTLSPLHAYCCCFANLVWGFAATQNPHEC